MEPEFTKKNIPDWLICDWFYFFFWLNLVIAVLYFVFIVTAGAAKGLRAATMTGGIIGMLLGATNMLFFYLVCDRSLKPTA